MKKEKDLIVNTEVDNILITNPDVNVDDLACSSYSEGKCLDKDGKYCDCCASEYGNEY